MQNKTFLMLGPPLVWAPAHCTPQHTYVGYVTKDDGTLQILPRAHRGRHVVTYSMRPTIHQALRYTTERSVVREKVKLDACQPLAHQTCGGRCRAAAPSHPLKTKF
jgi:hypothetical protein